MNSTGSQHQEFQPLPQLGTPIVDPTTGIADASWYRFIISLWQKLGGTRSEQTTAVFVQQTGPTSVVLRNAQTGVQIGGFIVTDSELSKVLDLEFGAIEGQILQRGPLSWQTLAPGTINQVLTSNGPGALNAWKTPTVPVGSALTLISTIPASGSPSLSWGGLSGTSWKLTGRMIVPAAIGTNIKIQFGTGAGPTFATANYRYSSNGVSSVAGYVAMGSEAGNGVRIADFVSTVTPGIATLECEIITDNANWVSVAGTINWKGDGTHAFHDIGASFGGSWPTAAPITGIRILADAGLLASGNASLYTLAV